MYSAKLGVLAIIEQTAVTEISKVLTAPKK
jgi:hypothetical protein